MEIAHCSTVPNDKKISIWYPSPINRNSSRAWQPLSRVNVTGLLRRLQVKIENIYLFKILIKKHDNVFKSWLCPNFLLLPKKSELPKIWGGCSPPRPPGPYAYAPGFYIGFLAFTIFNLVNNLVIGILYIIFNVFLFTVVVFLVNGKIKWMNNDD